MPVTSKEYIDIKQRLEYYDGKINTYTTGDRDNWVIDLNINNTLHPAGNTE